MHLQGDYYHYTALSAADQAKVQLNVYHFNRDSYGIMYKVSMEMCMLDRLCCPVYGWWSPEALLSSSFKHGTRHMCCVQGKREQLCHCCIMMDQPDVTSCRFVQMPCRTL
jgi:hypothetical protein